MLTNEDLDRIERDAAEMEYFPLHDEVADLVKMARRYLWLRDEADAVHLRQIMRGCEAELLPGGEHFYSLDDAIDSAINSQRKEGGEG